jgi:hypothetical protein
MMEDIQKQKVILKVQQERAPHIYKVRRDDGSWFVSSPPREHIQHPTFSLYTGFNDDAGHFLFTGDLVDLDIQNEFGSIQKGAGIVVWDTNAKACLIDVFSNVARGMDTRIVKVVRLGNVWDNPEKIYEFCEKFGYASCIKRVE